MEKGKSHIRKINSQKKNGRAIIGQKSQQQPGTQNTNWSPYNTTQVNNN